MAYVKVMYNQFLHKYVYVMGKKQTFSDQMSYFKWLDLVLKHVLLLWVLFWVSMRLDPDRSKHGIY